MKEHNNRLANTFRTAATKIKETCSKVNAKKLLASRAFLVGGCAVLIVAAVAVSAVIGKHTGDNIDDASESGKLLGNSVLVGEHVSGISGDGMIGDATSGAMAEEPNDRLALTVLNRTAVREDAMAVLQTIADNPDALPNEKEEALAKISSIMSDMAAEANIETLTLAKGIPQCVAVISGGQCSIIVDAATITDEELSQIVEIVYEQSGILPIHTKVLLESQE